MFNVSYKCTRGAVYEKPAECGLMDWGFTVPSACVRWGNQVQVKQQCHRQGHKQKPQILIFIEGHFLSRSPPPLLVRQCWCAFEYRCGGVTVCAYMCVNVCVCVCVCVCVSCQGPQMFLRGAILIHTCSLFHTSLFIPLPNLQSYYLILQGRASPMGSLW